MGKTLKDTNEDLVTIPRARIIRFLKDNPDSTKERIENQTGMSRGALTPHLILLKKKGLIVFSKPKNMRGNPTLINITPKANPAEQILLDLFDKAYSFYELIKGKLK